jgi:hypothetical protein
MIKPRNEINDKLAERRLKQAHKLILEGADFDSSYNYFDVETSENRCLTFYFDDIKN